MGLRKTHRPPTDKLHVATGHDVDNPYWRDVAPLVNWHADPFHPTAHANRWRRDGLRRRYANTISAPSTINHVVAACGTDPILNLFAGTGYWAHLLAAAGVDVIAYDPDPAPPARRHTVVFAGEPVAALHMMPARTLLAEWPPDPVELLAMLDAYAGERIIIMGDDSHEAHATLFASGYRCIDLFAPIHWAGARDVITTYLHAPDEPADECEGAV